MKASKTPERTALVAGCVKAVVADLRAEPDPKVRPTIRTAAARSGEALGLSARRARAYVDGDVTITTESELATVQAALEKWSKFHAIEVGRRFMMIRHLAGRSGFSRADRAEVARMMIDGRHDDGEDPGQVQGGQAASG